MSNQLEQDQERWEQDRRMTKQEAPPPSSYEEYLLLTEKDKLRLLKQNRAKRPNARLDRQEEARP
jgi:hypothetical protein